MSCKLRRRAAEQLAAMVPNVTLVARMKGGVYSGSRGEGKGALVVKLGLILQCSDWRGRGKLGVNYRKMVANSKTEGGGHGGARTDLTF
jgi:hypothetical protein